MDIATALGLLAGVGVLAALILMGGDLRMFVDSHAFRPARARRRASPPGSPGAFRLRRLPTREPPGGHASRPGFPPAEPVLVRA
jgi:hypothetical protein